MAKTAAACVKTVCAAKCCKFGNLAGEGEGSADVGEGGRSCDAAGAGEGGPQEAAASVCAAASARRAGAKSTAAAFSRRSGLAYVFFPDRIDPFPFVLLVFGA